MNSPVLLLPSLVSAINPGFGVFDLFGELVDEESTVARFTRRRGRGADRLVEDVGYPAERLLDLGGCCLFDALGVRREVY